MDACDESDDIVAQSQESLSVCRANPGDQPGCSTRAILERIEKICNSLLVDFKWQAEANRSPGKTSPS